MTRHDDTHHRSSVRLLAAAVVFALLFCITLWAMVISTLHFAGTLKLPPWILAIFMIEVILGVMGFAALAIHFAFAGAADGNRKGRSRRPNH